MEDKDLRDEGSTTGSDVKAAPFFRKSLLDGAITVAGVVTKDSMGEDIPEAIRYFGKRNKIFFVHFRDIRGDKWKFEETFHDEGKTDMYEAMRTYFEVDFKGPMRPDHVPTVAGDNNDHPGYSELGTLFAIGYIKGLIEAAAKNA